MRLPASPAVPANGRTQLLTPSQALTRWEGLCDPAKGCGVACCYYEGSPCTELDLETKQCRIYDHRFGLRATMDGKRFRCASMREFLLHKPAPTLCGYRVVQSIEGVPVVRGQT